MVEHQAPQQAAVPVPRAGAAVDAVRLVAAAQGALVVGHVVVRGEVGRVLGADEEGGRGGALVGRVVAFLVRLFWVGDRSVIV